MKNLLSIIILVLVVCVSVNYAQKESPANIAAALTLKLAGFDSKLSGDVKIFVVGNENVAKELKKGVGNAIGGGNLSAVDFGDDIPGSKYSIIFCGITAKLTDVKKYSRQNKALSVTNIPELVSKGITLGIGIGDDNKPKILLNLSSSIDEGVEWNPAIMKVAETIK
jgi:hypothetical protein